MRRDRSIARWIRSTLRKSKMILMDDLVLMLKGVFSRICSMGYLNKYGCWWARSCKGYDVPKDSLCQLNMGVNVGSPPDAIYTIVIDIDNKRVFKNIQEVLSIKVLFDEGSR